MCGISGIVSFKRSAYNLLHVTDRMNHTIRHRGPDDEGFVAFENNQYFSLGSEDTDKTAWDNQYPYLPSFHLQSAPVTNPEIVFGHRRLSIINLTSAGHQPMCDKDGRYWLVFNGAIYNYEELKKELVDLGHQFYSQTDTEVLLYAYIQWGSECVNKFIGMWAFAIYDKEQRKIFASRDRIGVKPFYYTFDQNYFAFASEIKALKTLPYIEDTLNNEVIYDYLVLGKCEQDEESIFKGIFELKPSCNLELEIDNHRLKKWDYYKPDFNSKWERYNETHNKKHVENLEELLQDSIRLHLRTDVPVGACLSGGLDSSLITSLISQKRNQLPVFTVTSKGDAEDESYWAKLVAEKFNLPWYTTNPQPLDLVQNFEDLMYSQDLPCLSANSYTHFELMRLVNRKGVKVTIDGQGADELFAGYTQYYAGYLLDAFRNGSLNSIFHALKEPGNDFANKRMALSIPLSIGASKLLGSRLTSNLFRKKHHEFSFINKDFWNSYKERISTLQNKIQGGLNSTLFHEYHGNSLKTMLRVGDRNSMRFGIETRVPFSDDYRIEEFIFKVPAIYKVKNNFGKALLREVSIKWLPHEICYRKDKKGFSLPEKRWMMEMSEEGLSYFNDSLAPYLNVNSIKENWERTLKQSHSTVRLWRILCFAVWMKTWKSS